MLKTDGMGREDVLEHVLGMVAAVTADTPNKEEDPPYRVVFKNWLFRHTIGSVFRVIFLILCRVRIYGQENVPSKSAYIIAYNHISYFEPPLLLAFWPYFPEAVAGADVFERPAVKFFVNGYAAIPVHRGEYDRKVIETMLAALTAGLPIAIAPEGGRGHKAGLRQARAGVAYLMDRARVPVIPVGISGTSDDMLKRALRGQRPELGLHIGKPFNLPPIQGQGEARRAARQANADLVMQHIAATLPEEYWGVYKPVG